MNKYINSIWLLCCLVFGIVTGSCPPVQVLKGQLPHCSLYSFNIMEQRAIGSLYLDLHIKGWVLITGLLLVGV